MNKRPGYKGLQNTHLSHPTYHLGLDFSVLMLAPLNCYIYIRNLLHQETFTPKGFNTGLLLRKNMFTL